MKYLILTLSLLMMLPLFPDSNAVKAQTKRSIAHNHNKRKVRHTTRRIIRKKVSRRAHYKYAHLPKYRAYLTAVPDEAIIVKTNQMNYRYHNGIFYKPSGNRFIVIRPVVGIRVSYLPEAHRKIELANKNYYYYFGTFYVKKDSGYEVIEAPEGALVDALPDGYDIKVINETEYYVVDGDFYQEVETDEIGGGIGYEVVNL